MHCVPQLIIHTVQYARNQAQHGKKLMRHDNSYNSERVGVQLIICKDQLSMDRYEYGQLSSKAYERKNSFLVNSVFYENKILCTFQGKTTSKYAWLVRVVYFFDIFFNLTRIKCVVRIYKVFSYRLGASRSALVIQNTSLVQGPRRVRFVKIL